MFKNIFIETLILFIIIVPTTFLSSCDDSVNPPAGPLYSISYETNGSDSGDAPIDDKNYAEGDTATVLDSGSLSKSGYSFFSWNTAADHSGQSYSAGDTLEIKTSDVLLYAHWTLNPTYSVIYSGNGYDSGTAPDDDNEYEADTEVLAALPGNMVKTGYTFSGWNTMADGSGTDYTPGEAFAMPSSNINLYARWIHSSLINLEKRDMVTITGGTFNQKATSGTPDNFDHTISDFEIARYELTYEIWYTVHSWAIANGYTFQNPGCEGDNGAITDPAGEPPSTDKWEPVTTVSSRDALIWCNAYSQMCCYTPCYTYGGNFIKDSRDAAAVTCDNAACDWNANGYRLPTEGERYFAATGRGITPYNFASGASADYSDAAATQKVAWYGVNAGGHTHVVGTTDNSSAMNLWDMSGNMQEWCWDFSGNYPVTDQIDYRGAAVSSGRMCPGGKWTNAATDTQCGHRAAAIVTFAVPTIGLRVARYR
ncbi:MAG: SUMF1/EgtB/PvdO family nonheme iron enzyme [Spirochaetales bacterium]|nr:SUMF1/EgtB/PvdO family nonheme iron enzyme [Spirochaetales bacterium]